MKNSPRFPLLHAKIESCPLRTCKVKPLRGFRKNHPRRFAPSVFFRKTLRVLNTIQSGMQKGKPTLEAVY